MMTPPLPAFLLADTSDSLADQLAEFAGELNLHHIQYETDALIISGYSKFLVRLAARIRA